MKFYTKEWYGKNGYEVHMLFCTSKALRYLTICCQDIAFEDNIALEVVPQGGTK